jgi:U3 small nucleolar RNA-associated protein 15
LRSYPHLLLGSLTWLRALATEIYTPTLGLSPLIDSLFTRLRRKVDEELTFQQELTAVRGALEMVFASSQQSLVKPVASVVV